MKTSVLSMLNEVKNIKITRHYCDGNHHRGPAIAILCLGHSSMKSNFKDTNNHVVSVDHVKMNSWCKFGECSTNRY